MKLSRKNVSVINLIWEKIKEYKLIILSRHKRPDGDAIGSCCGLASVIRDNFPNKKVLVVNSDTSEQLLPFDRNDQDIPESEYSKALMIITDTADQKRISNNSYKSAKEIIVIDHHPDTEKYGDIHLIEHERSSVSELIVKMVHFSKEKLILSKKSSTLIYLGMVTDTNRFQYSPSAECLYYASVLLENGADAELIYRTLYLKPLSYLKYQTSVSSLIKTTPDGVAYIILSEEKQKELNLSSEDASECVNFMCNISDCPVYIAFIYDSSKKEYRVRLRSRDIDISGIARKHGGGGHKFASGATVLDLNEIKTLLNEAGSEISGFQNSLTKSENSLLKQ